MTPPRTSAPQPYHEGPARTPRAGPSPSPHSRSQRDAELLILDDVQQAHDPAALPLTPLPCDDDTGPGPERCEASHSHLCRYLRTRSISTCHRPPHSITNDLRPRDGRRCRESLSWFSSSGAWSPAHPRPTTRRTE